MSSKEPSLVRGIAIDAWRDMRKRPLMWLLISASSIPLVFLVNFFLPRLFFIPAFSQTTYMLLQLVGYSICFTVLFLFWCMAVFYFDDEVRGKGRLSYRAAYYKMKGWALPAIMTGLVFGLIRMFAVIISQMVLGIVLNFLVTSQTADTSLEILNYVYFYLNFIVADLIIVFVILAPQMLCLEGGRKVDEVLRATYYLVKERYRNSLILLLIPEVIVGTLYLGANLLEGSLAAGTSISPGTETAVALIIMVFVALLEGARTAFLATAFNRFYYLVLEEEKKKRKGKGKKQPAVKQPQKKAPTGKGSSKKQSGGKQSKKRK